MKRIFALVALSILTSCSGEYNIENPQNRGDFVAAVMSGAPTIFNFSEKQDADYWACMSPRIAEIEENLTAEETSAIDEILAVIKADPDASRPDLELQVMILSASIVDHGEESFRECVGATGMPFSD